MPTSITEAFVQQFDTQMRLECGQKESRLQRTITDRGNITGESFTANMLEDDGGTLAQNTTRHGDTVWSDATHLTPLATMLDYYDALPVDRADEPKLLANPSGPYMDLLMRRKNRRIDKIIYDAARGTQTLKDGSTEALPSGQKIAHGSTGMTKTKLIECKKLFRANECDEHNGEELFITFDSKTLEDILADTTLTSADYMAVKMLQSGDVSGRWMGFTWIPYEAIYNDGTTYYNIAWAKSGIQFGTGFLEGNVQRRGDKKDTLQVSMAASWGALRTQAEKVVEIAFQ
ncbi:MAG: phage capsid protein [Salinisphaeraceae bacterium]|nr:phage capsid protein [Salinisphaeraceae bacterium]